MVNIYIGTRSGNILLVKRQSTFNQNEGNYSNLNIRKQVGTSNNLSNVESIKQISRRNSVGLQSLHKFTMAG